MASGASISAAVAATQGAQPGQLTPLGALRGFAAGTEPRR